MLQLALTDIVMTV